MRMRTKLLSIRLKLTVIAVLISLFSFGIAAFLSRQWVARAFERHYEEKAMLLCADIIRDLDKAMLSGSHEGISEIVKISRAREKVKEVKVFNLRGQKAFGQEQGPSDPRIEETLRTGKIAHSHGEIGKEEVAFFTIPIRNKPECHGCHGKGEELRGAILLALSLEEMERNVAQKTRKFLILFAAIAVAVSAATIIAVNRFVLNPLWSIKKGAEAIGGGDFKTQIPIASNDEIGELAQTVNHMSKQLRDSFESIQRSQKAMIQAEKLSSLGQLSAGLAHEVKNPLTSIKLILQTILDGSHTPEMRTEDLEVILKEVKKLDSFLTRFLAFAKPSRLQMGSLNLSQIVEEVLSLMKTKLDRNGVEVFKEIPSDLPEIEGNHEKIREVLVNLLLNSVQTMPDGGKLRIEARQIFENHQRGILLQVEDSGEGIAEEFREKIFDPFFTTKESGTGLGLSIAYNIVEEHHGKIEFTSEVGKGTIFSITLPQEQLREDENEQDSNCR